MIAKKGSRRMLTKTPLKTVCDNLLLTRTGDVWAYYRIAPTNINSGDIKQKEAFKKKFRFFIEQLEGYKNFDLDMMPKQMNLNRRNQELEKDFDTTLKIIGKYYNRETERILENELNTITRNQFILGVKLKENVFENDDMKSVVQNSIASVTDTILNVLNMSREVDDDFFERFKVYEKELYQLTMGVNGRRLSEDELIYLNRYNFIRDMQHSIEEESQKRALYNITNTLIDPSTAMGYLKLTTPEGERWLTHVVVNDMTLDMNYTHIFERAQNFSFPVEFKIKANFKTKEAVLRKASLTKTRVRQMASEKIKTGDDIEDAVKDTRFVLNRLESQLNSQNQKFIEWMGTFCVTGATKEECRHRAKQVIRTLTNKKIECVQPLADQLQLFYKFLPGHSLAFEKHWMQQTPSVAFAENLFGVSQQLGNNAGFYLGRINRYLNNNTIADSIASSRDVVLFHPFIANKGIEGAMTDSPHISITGETGKGKSFLVKMLLMFLAMLDVKTLYIDPKSEVEMWFKRVLEDDDMRRKYPLFIQLIEGFSYVTLNGNDSANHGVLDPIVMLKGTDAKDTAQSIVEQIYNLDDKDDIKRVFLRTLTEVITERSLGQSVGFRTVVERMRAHDEKVVSDAGELLHEQIKNSVLQLVFSDGEVKGLDLKSKVNVIGIEGLDLPDSSVNSKDYSDGERKSLALMIPLAKFCETFGMQNKNQETVEIFDEGWMLTTARAGKKLIKQMRRVGRSYNNALILVTQSVKDVNTDDDNGNFGVNFAFDEKSERKDILRFLNLEVEEEHENVNEELLANMIKGECYFKDIYGRIGKIAVDCLFEEWMYAFKTVEKSHSSRAEKMFE